MTRCLRCGRKTYKGKKTCFQCFQKEYLRNYLNKKRKRKQRHEICIECKTKHKVMPFVGLCQKCYKKFRT